MPRHRRPTTVSRLGAAAALAALLLPATAPQAQKFPPDAYPGQSWPGYGPVPPPGYGHVPPQEGGQPYSPAPPGSGGGKSGSRPAAAPAPRPRPMPAAAPVQADLPAEALQLQAEDPPAVVGRVARVQGEVGLRLPDGEAWRPAALNTAIVAGNALWTEPGARAAIEAGQSRLVLDGATALQIEAMDEAGLRATLAQGTLFLRLRGLESLGGTVDIATPEASVATALDGRILIEAAAPDGSRPGRIAVFEGAAEVTLASSRETLRLGPGEAIRLVPGAAPEFEPAGPTTPLMAWALGAEPRMPIPATARGMTGVEELGLTGRWERSPDYGDVWYPPVPPDWAPYSDGSWEWREPWGWTWVDAAPWGFATSHYGRWVRLGPRWAWAPAPVPVTGLPPLRPVWAPALVAFFSLPVAGPVAGRPVGWVPLAPREPWYPWYRASPAYVARVNIRQVVHLAPVRERWVAHGGPASRWDGSSPERPRRDAPPAWVHDRRPEEFRNRQAAILVPERALLASLPVRAEARRATPDLLRRAAAPDLPPLRPGPETRGLTERAAERFGLPPEAVRAARPERAPRPPEALRTALPPPSPRPPVAAERNGPPRPDPDRDTRRQADDGPRPPASFERAPAGADLRQRLIEEQARRREREDGEHRRAAEAPAAGAPTAGAPTAGAQRRQELRQRLQEGNGPDRPAWPDMRRDEAADAVRRQQMEQARQQQQQELRRQQAEDVRRRHQELQRQQADEARRQQQDMQRRQSDQARQQQQQELRRQQADEARRQQQELQRQQMEQVRRQQQDMQRYQMEQARHQQQEMRRQQMEQMGRQQQELQRQQMEQARRQQQEMQRQQMEQARRQQQDVQRQQMEQARRQQAQQQRREERQR